MKFTAAVFASALVASASALAAPQESAPTSLVTSLATTTTPMTPQQTCLAGCNPGDVTCQASCITVPSPNEAQANQTTECAANCNQGSGSPADTDAYSRCVQGCISSFFISTNTGVATMMPSGTGSTMLAMTTGTVTSGTRSSSASDSSATSGSSASGSSSGSTSQSSSGTATGTAASSTSTGAAGKLQLGSSLAGAAGLLLAVVAL